ncbi:hypothetical protein MUK42_35888 [Musa troglodytarum]|uniref:Uncharacterized protein n=1 Tax=Musa troglodytarum TaxID=320322 RepID=A0A9E7GAY8_9LILI|nr:hypothetical protein MUK42_35888 [Musa troglodytarum]
MPSVFLVGMDLNRRRLPHHWSRGKRPPRRSPRIERGPISTWQEVGMGSGIIGARGSYVEEGKDDLPTRVFRVLGAFF